MTWQIDFTRRVVGFLDNEGTFVVPSAVEIFDLEFDGISIPHASHLPRPSTVLPELAFEGTFAPFEFRLKRGGSGVELRLGVSADSNSECELFPEFDQVIIGNKWFACSIVEIKVWSAELAQEGISLNAPLTVSQVVWLLNKWSTKVASELNGTDYQSALLSAESLSIDPNLLEFPMYEYQIEGAKFLVRNAFAGLGGVLADEMGLGKTLQVIYLLAHVQRAKPSSTSLVVVLSSTLSNWERELAKFAPQLKVYVHAGSRRSGDPNFLMESNVILTSFDLLQRDRYLLESVPLEVAVLDEAQSIKNDEAKRTIAAKSLNKKASFAVTGTPIETSLKDLWSIIDFVSPGLLNDFEEFEYEYPDEQSAARRLSMKVAPLTLRRTVSDVADDLPPRVDTEVPLRLSTTLAHEYEAIRLSETLPLAKMQQLRMLCSAATESSNAIVFREIPKLQRLGEILESIFANGSKAIVFAPFKISIDLIQEMVNKHFPSVFSGVADGRTSPADRQNLIDAFTNERGAAVLILNPRAAGVGLNIQAANYVIHFSPEWNPAVMAQASARSHRRGQTKTVFVYYLFYEGTVEETMMSRLADRRELAAEGLSEFTSELDDSEILAALALNPESGRNIEAD